jgi:hypothetical protein
MNTAPLDFVLLRLGEPPYSATRISAVLELRGVER